MKPTIKGRALFYHRDSGGKAEMTPTEYVVWTQRCADELGLSFDGTPERINAMIRENRSVYGDLFLDYDVKGNLLSRNGLNALIKEAINDPRVKAVMIPRRDRLGPTRRSARWREVGERTAHGWKDDRLHGPYAGTAEKGP